MLYESTRGSLNKKTGAQAVIRGIAEDRGLYVPEFIPALPLSISEMVGKSYREIAKVILSCYFDDFTEEEIDYCVNGAYDEKFDADDMVELNKEGDAYFLELYHGKTAAFKDMALSILPYLLTTAMKKEGIKEKVCILTATSGDTGKAALEGFKDVDGTEIIVFFPEDGVSEVQKRQMISQEGKNTHVFGIKGNFDDAQTGVKNIFDNRAFVGELKKQNVILSSANSINIGRLVPQIAYYVYSYVKLLERGDIKDGDKINIAVPTGNFGNILAAYMAKEMGLPINRLICCSNDNKVLTDFLRTGLYDIRPVTRDFKCTNSPSMDILISSNLERLLYIASGKDAKRVSGWMEMLSLLKLYTVMDSEMLMGALKDFYAGFSTEDECLDTINKMWSENGYLMDTHTGVAYKVYEDYVKETGDKTPTVIASTASAYKFAEAVSNAIGLEKKDNGFEYVKALNEATKVKIPYGLLDLDKKEILHKGIVEISEMEDAVKNSLANNQKI